MSKNNCYTAVEHSHRYASWCASTAASRSPLCRFKVKQGKDLIEKSGLQKWGEGWNKLPGKGSFDEKHAEMRKELKKKASSVGIKRGFTHGVAAKLINVYLKTIYQTSPCKLSSAEEGKKNSLHPPIDNVLKKSLIKKYQEEGSKELEQEWRAMPPWSKLDIVQGVDQYQYAINLVRTETKGKLWRIEEYFQGHQ